MTSAPVRVVVVEDSPAERARLVAILQRTNDITVIGEAARASEAVELVARLRPDVVTLDLQLGGGYDALEQIMAATPIPILVLTPSSPPVGSAPAAQALAAGAVLAMARPARWTEAQEHQFRRDVHTASRVHVFSRRRSRAQQGRNEPVPPRPSAPAATQPQPGLRCVVAIGASAGGPSALATVLGGLGGLPAAVLVVQHIHPDFVPGLVDWMTRASALPVAVGIPGEVVRRGRVYIGPGGAHLRLLAGLRLDLDSEPPSVHRPSVDRLFESVAELRGVAVIGVLLTGMGEDGARGLLAVRHHGGRTIAQDEATSAVFGMPQAACRLGAAEFVLPLPEIAARILKLAREVTV